MVFSSIEFLGVFLPLFLAAYFLTYKYAKAYRNALVFLFSIGFYAYGTIVTGTPLYLLIILLSVLFNFFAGLSIGRCRDEIDALYEEYESDGKPIAERYSDDLAMDAEMPRRRVSEEHSHARRAFRKKVKAIRTRQGALLFFGLVIDFGILFLFKYSDFVFGTDLGLILPIGISFYTFQIVSYLIDVYRGDSPAEKSFVNLGAYIMMFPQLIAGPIVRFSTVQKDLRKRRETRGMFLSGVRTFIIGLGFKVIIANQLGNLWSEAANIGYESISVPMAWLSMFAYSFQLYFDFYGYSLMAIGLGNMMGFTFPENFDSPYISVSMTEFWRRWHMTLGTWFKEYVYIPLGGNRCGSARTVFNLFAVWMLTGIWHGADWNFVIWGFVLFAIIAIEKFGIKDFMESHRAAGHIYMILLIPLQWMVFAISDLKQLGVLYGRLIGIGGINVNGSDWTMQLKDFWWILILAVILSTDLPKKIYRRFQNSPITYVLLAAVLGVVIWCLKMGLNDPFLYFRF